jgi:hypothetical protein
MTVWYKTPKFKTLIQDVIATVIGLVILRITRPILKLNPDIQSLLDILYLDIRNPGATPYFEYINMVLSFLSFYSLPFFIAGYIAGFIGARKAGALLGLIPSLFYTVTFVFLVPLIHVSNKASSAADDWLVWAVLHPALYLVSGVTGGILGWLTRNKIQAIRQNLKTTL